MTKVPLANFTEFINFFPRIEPPFSLLPDIGLIPSSDSPLPLVLIESYILPFEGEETDEYTEYIPYGSIMGIKDFHAFIYWKAGVMQYEFILATFDLNGNPISHGIVGGLRSDENGLLHSVAVIHEDLTITIAEALTAGGTELNLDQTSTYQMVIEPSGLIRYGTHEE